jgi:hypothetical protein
MFIFTTYQKLWTRDLMYRITSYEWTWIFCRNGTPIDMWPQARMSAAVRYGRGSQPAVNTL